MATEHEHLRLGDEELRRVVPAFALAVAVVAAVADPADGLDVALAAIPVAGFALWALRPAVPLAALAAAVLVPVVVVQRSGALEPLMFEASLLAIVAGRWTRSLAASISLGVVCAVTPLVVGAVQGPSQVSVAIWVLGIAFPWAIGRAVARQRQLTEQLDETRRRLAEQALLEERRKVARDVHDFVGHGLAAVMLQVTSARHVLRRDPAAADEALRSAEEVGRQSMGELRRTVALLRSAQDEPVAAPLPTAADVRALVEQARAGGLAVEMCALGDLSAIPPSAGAALYRIAQEALANAARHAPQARTVVTIERVDDHVTLVADTVGPAAARPTDGGGFGVIGMRERASALGGELVAGPTPDGWRVRCRLPLDP